MHGAVSSGDDNMLQMTCGVTPTLTRVVSRHSDNTSIQSDLKSPKQSKIFSKTQTNKKKSHCYWCNWDWPPPIVILQKSFWSQYLIKAFHSHWQQHDFLCSVYVLYHALYMLPMTTSFIYQPHYLDTTFQILCSTNSLWQHHLLSTRLCSHWQHHLRSTTLSRNYTPTAKHLDVNNPYCSHGCYKL